MTSSLSLDIDIHVFSLKPDAMLTDSIRFLTSFEFLVYFILKYLLDCDCVEFTSFFPFVSIFV